MEAGVGIEPASTALQTVAFPYKSISYNQYPPSCHPKLTVGRQNTSKREQLRTFSAATQTASYCFVYNILEAGTEIESV